MAYSANVPYARMRMEKGEMAGHTKLPLSDFSPEELELLRRENDIIVTRSFVQTKAFYEAEKRIAEILRLLCNRPPKRARVGSFVEEYERQKGITLTAAQRQSVNMALSHRFSVITGGPGTGKSSILDCVLYALRRKYPKATFALLAPTGKAASRMSECTGAEAHTIHHAIGMGYDGRCTSQKRLSQSLVIVDEVSMMDTRLFLEFLEAAKDAERIVLVGDEHQLPSVGAGNVLHDLLSIPYVARTKLTKTVRQKKENLIPYNAQHVLKGQGVFTTGKSFQFLEAEDEESAYAQLLSQYKEALTQYAPDEICVLVPFATGGKCNAKKINRLLRPVVHKNPPKFLHWQYALGDRVLCKKNSEVANGELGRVTGGGSTWVDVAYREKTVRYTEEDAERIDLAYALTVHKSQGSQFQKVFFVLLPEHVGMMHRNLVYTAITRASQSCTVVGSRKTWMSSMLKIGAERQTNMH